MHRFFYQHPPRAKYGILRISFKLCLFIILGLIEGCATKHADSFKTQGDIGVSLGSSDPRVIKKGSKYCVMINGIEGNSYDKVYDLSTSPDKGRVAYIGVKALGSVVVVIDGIEHQYNDVVLGSLRFSPDSKHFVYAARRGSMEQKSTWSEEGWKRRQGRRIFFVVLDGKEQEMAWDAIARESPVFSPDSQHLAYAGYVGDLDWRGNEFKPYGEWFFVVDDDVVGTYTSGFRRQDYLYALEDFLPAMEKARGETATLLNTELVSILEVDGKPNKARVVRVQPGDHTLRVRNGLTVGAEATLVFTAQMGKKYVVTYERQAPGVIAAVVAGVFENWRSSVEHMKPIPVP
jgi:hypothetical protein